MASVDAISISNMSDYFYRHHNVIVCKKGKFNIRADLHMYDTRVQSVERRSGSTAEAIKSLASCPIRELKEKLIVSGGVETTSHPKPVSVKTMNEEFKSKKHQLSHSAQTFCSGTTGVVFIMGK